jgi:hypothetical protein
MKQYCYVILNNAGHSWAALSAADPGAPKEADAAVLPLLLQAGWAPVRETPMGGGTSPLAHSLVLLEKETDSPEKKTRPARPARKAT